jgi:phosphoglycerol transferase
VNRIHLPSVSRTALIWSIILVILCAIYLIITLGLTSGARLDVPFTYEGDGLEYNLLTKTVIETGWWLENPMTGAPGTLEMYDYAIGNNLDFLIMKIISLFSGNYAVVMNLYYILGFFLTALFSLYTFRELRISYPLSVAGSILFTFIFYHFYRIAHFNLTAFYMVPLMVLVILWVCQGEPLFTGKKGKEFPVAITHKGYLAAIILLITSTHSYYGYFALLFLAVATLWSASRSYDMRTLVNGAITGILLALFMVLNKLPSILYGLQHGPSFVMSYRYPYESEIWGMKLIQLLLPAPGHRIPLLADIAQKYTENRPLVNENVSASLGIFGSIGLVLLLGWIFLRGWPPLQKKLAGQAGLMDHLSLLTISAILIGTIGGISAVIAQVFPDIHSYNRISVYIGFFSILAVLVLLQIIFEQYRTRPLFCPVFLVLLLVVVTGGVFDQVPAGYALTAGTDREQEFLSQAAYFSQVEERMPDGASVFILPDIGGFPHSNPPGKIKGLDSLKPYLHTHSLKWSYPTMKGRFWDNWQVAVSASEPSDVLGHLFTTGFTGLLIDGYGYGDGGKETFASYQNLTGVTPLVSDDRRYAFYDLTGFMEEKKSGITPEQFAAEKQNYIQTMQTRSELQNPIFGSEVRNQMS